MALASSKSRNFASKRAYNLMVRLKLSLVGPASPRSQFSGIKSQPVKFGRRSGPPAFHGKLPTLAELEWGLRIAPKGRTTTDGLTVLRHFLLRAGFFAR